DQLNYQWIVKQKLGDNSYSAPIVNVEDGEANFHFVPEPPASGEDDDFTYRVELTVTDSDGGETSMVRKFTVANDSSGGNGSTESVLTPETQGGADAMAVQSDGKILLLGARSAIEGDLIVTRYNADLTLDTGFGDAGKAVLRFPAAVNHRNLGLAVDPANRII